MTTSTPVLQAHDIPAGAGTVRAVEVGDPDGPPVVFLHGWPESWQAWDSVLGLAADDGFRAIALDLPGIGGSASSATGGRKRDVAEVVHDALGALGVEQPTIVGHDAGGMVAYAYLRAHPETIAGTVIVSVVIPGLDPWEQVLAIPQLWHFAFHSVPDLPAELVRGKERTYFDYFYGATAARPEAITPEHRAAHTDAYRAAGALEAGFDLYRALAQDAEDNTAPESTTDVDAPLLYLRGTGEFGDMAAYERGFRAAGITELTTGLIDGAGHYGPEESPDSLWPQVRVFATAHAQT